MRASRFRAAALAVLAAVAAEPRAARSEAEVHARFRQTLAVEFERGRAQKLELEALPRIGWSLPWGFQLAAEARLRLDPLDRIEPGRPGDSTYFPASRRLLVGDEGEAELRELTIERAFGRAYLTLGKQQVVWGRADGVKLLDVVDPQSFREFILPPFDESRIPLWTANVELEWERAALQLLWIPDNSVHDIPDPGAAFEITSSVLVPAAPPGIDLVVARPRRPRAFFADSDAGMRLSTAFGDWDLTLHYLYHYEDTPVLGHELLFGPDGLTVLVTPRYERSHVAGVTSATTFGDFALRTEAGFFSDRFVATNDIFDPDGLAASREYAALLGLDWFGLGGGAFVSMQWLQSFVPDLPRAAIRGEAQSIATLVFRRPFAAEAGLVQTMLLVDGERGDGLLRGRVSYEATAHLTVAAGMDVFYGSNRGIFGQFDDRDRVVLELEQAL